MTKTITNRLNTIDGETLMSQPLKPLNFVVDTLLSQGLHILAGSPKVGKSWLALWLAVTVAKGEPVWGMRVKRGTTLYLCLEDSQLRIQNRLFNVTEDAPANVHFCTESHILGDGLTEQLEQFLSEHPDTTLVIIDTLQMIRGTTYDNTYANDYRDLSVLKHLADAHGIAILLIHHLRKEKADDVFNRISGTTAISGGLSEQAIAVPSPEDAMMDAQEQQERLELRRMLMEGLDNCLTPIQRRRLWLYCVDGLTVRQIAEAEKACFQSIDKAIIAAKKKMKKFLGE